MGVLANDNATARPGRHVAGGDNCGAYPASGGNYAIVVVVLG